MEKTKKKRRKKGSFLMFLGLLLMAAALFLTIYNLWDAKRAGNEASRVVEELTTEMETGTDEDLPDLYKEGDEMPVKVIDGYRYIGVLEIPELGLLLPVMEEWDYTRLNIAPCRYEGFYITNDLVIAGHNYSTHFGPIRNLQPGAKVYFVNVENRVYEYRVDSIEILEPTQVKDLKTNGEWDLTLFTCNSSGFARCTVRCVKE